MSKEKINKKPEDDNTPVRLEDFEIDDSSGETVLYLDFSHIFEKYNISDEKANCKNSRNKSNHNRYWLDNIDINPAKTFSDFIADHVCNTVIETTQKIIQNTYDPKYNPLYIYGKDSETSELLLHCIFNEITDNYHDYSVCYIDTFSLIRKISNWESGKDISIVDPWDSLINSLQIYDFILFNGIEYLRESKLGQNIFLETITALKSLGKQLIFSATEPAEKLEKLSTGIISFIKSGICEDLDSPMVKNS